MAFRKLFLFTLYLGFHAAIAQDNNDIHVTWGKPFNVQMLSRLDATYLGMDGEDAMVVFRNQQSYNGINSAAQFCKINPAGEIVLQTELLVESKGKPAEYHAVYNLKGNIYLFTSFWDKSQHTEYIWANKIDSKGNLSSPSIELSQYKADSYDDVPTIDFMISQDSSSVIIAQAMLFQVFDQNLSKRLSQKITVPYADATTRELIDFTLSSKGILHVLCRFSLPKEINSDGKKEEERFFYNVSNYNLKTGRQTEYAPKVNAVSLSEAALELDDKGDVVLAGFCTKTNKRITDYEAFYSYGFFLVKYDAILNKEILNVQHSYTPELLHQLIPDNKLNSEEERLWGFSIDKIKFKPDGGIILVGQKSYTYDIRKDGYTVGTSFQYQQLLAVNLDSKGKLIWMNAIPVLHSTRDTFNFRYYSYILGITNSSVFFIYNENPRNADIADPRDYKHMDDPTKCISSSMVKIDSSGTMSKSQVFTNATKKELTYLEPTYSMPVNNTRYILLSSNKYISKIGFIDFLDR